MFKKIYSGIAEVVQELCTRGKYQDEYLRHADCVKNVRPEYEVCSKNYELTLTTLSNHQKNEEYQTDEVNVAVNQEKYLRTVCWYVEFILLQSVYVYYFLKGVTKM